jgi:hypothetical protein
MYSLDMALYHKRHNELVDISAASDIDDSEYIMVRRLNYTLKL